MAKSTRRARLFREKVQNIVNKIIDKHMEKKTFYRVGSIDNQQGLWYTPYGDFTGDIHGKYSFCTNTKLQMPFDRELVGWLSATPDLDELFFWFPIEDIKELEKHGYSIMLYEATDYKEYVHKDYKHLVINQKTSVLKELIGVSSLNEALVANDK